MTARVPLGLLASFAGLGATAAAIPAGIPLLARAVDAPAAQLLPMVPGLFGGLLLGMLATPACARRLGLGAVSRAGSGAQALGLLLVAAAPAPALAIVGAGVAGAGFGAVEAANGALLRRAGDTVRSLVLLTAAVSVTGATLPLAIVVAGDAAGLRVVLVLVAAAQLAIGVLLRVPPVAAPEPPDDAPRTRSILPVALPAAAALFLAVGAEAVLSGWSAVVAHDRLGLDPAWAALGTSAFFVLSGTGRLIAGALVPRRVPAALLTTLCVALLVLALAVALLEGAVGVVALALAVLACGPLYGLLLGRGLDAVPAVLAAPFSSLVVAAGALGGVLAPFVAVAALPVLGPGTELVVGLVAASALLVALHRLGARTREPAA